MDRFNSTEILNEFCRNVFYNKLAEIWNVYGSYTLWTFKLKIHSQFKTFKIILIQIVCSKYINNLNKTKIN